MADDNDTRAGMISGVLAVIMVILLSVMAFTALQPATEVANHIDAFGGSSGESVKLSPWLG